MSDDYKTNPPTPQPQPQQPSNPEPPRMPVDRIEKGETIFPGTSLGK